MVVLVLVTLGLLSTDVAAYVMLRSHMLGRTDTNLALVESQLSVLARRGTGRGLDAIDRIAPPQVLLVFFTATGEPIETVNRAVSDMPVGEVGDLTGLPLSRPTTVGEEPAYRMSRIDVSGSGLVVTTETGEQEVAFVVIGLSVQDEHDALDLLVVTAIVSGLAVLIIVGVVSSASLALGLRPLRQVSRTARAIASGDHAERIDVSGAGQELREVAEALNAAFDARASSEDEVRQFLADASHELRTPLAVVHGWADLYHEGGVRDWSSVDEAMANISNETGRMRALVEDMLTLARLGSRPALPGSGTVDIDAVVTDVADALAPLHPEHRLRVVPSGLRALGDDDALHRAVSNLVTNGGRHTPAGATITIRAESAADRIRVVVEDDGRGLTDLQRRHAFDRFWRLRGSELTGQTSGTGLGLAIARAAVRAYDGDLHLEAAEPQGLRAVISLRAVPAAAPDTAAGTGHLAGS